MRAQLRFSIEADPIHKRKHIIVMHLPEGRMEVLAGDLKELEAERLLMPLRRAVLAGIRWFRDDASSYMLAAHPEVTLPNGVR